MAVTYFFPDIEIRIHERKTVIFDNFPITDIFGKWLFGKGKDIVFIF